MRLGNKVVMASYNQNVFSDSSSSHSSFLSSMLPSAVYATPHIQELPSNTPEDMESNLQQLQQWVEEHEAMQ